MAAFQFSIWSADVKTSEKLRNAGQSLWLHPRSADVRRAQTIHAHASVTGLTSNPTIFDHAIAKSASLLTENVTASKPACLLVVFVTDAGLRLKPATRKRALKQEVAQS
jgi:hypothetical protein